MIARPTLAEADLPPHSMLERPPGTRSTPALVLGAACLLASTAARSQELEPKAYTNLPTGLNFLALGYAHSQGGLATDPALPLEDAHLRIHTGVAAYARSLDLWGRSGKFDIVVPYSRLSGNALVAGQATTRDISGFGDPRLRLSLNFYGAPALTLPEFRSYEQDLVIGGSLQLGVPAGQYDPNRAVNLGTHRWTLKPDIGFSKAFGAFMVDLTAGATFFSTNHDFFGGQTVEKAPLYSVQANLSYVFAGGAWASLGSTFYSGGRTTADGVRKDDELGNSRVGLTLSLPIDRNWSVKLNASSGTSTRTGTDFNTIGLVGQYRWGAGV
ncbi:MAG: transporter [Burkholderiales bacterium]|nr:transporter [Burkholderiales bacterium]